LLRVMELEKKLQFGQKFDLQWPTVTTVELRRSFGSVGIVSAHPLSLARMGVGGTPWKPSSKSFLGRV